MSKVSRFRLFNTVMGDHVAVVEMDEDLLAPDAGILDPNTMTLRGVKNGGQYTLLPIEDHTVASLKRVKEAYENTQKGANYFSTHLNRQDAMIDAVRLLFSDVEYTVVESRDDMEKILNPNIDRDFEAKKVKYTVLGDLLKDAEAKAGVEPEGEEGHVHGPGCGH